MPTKHNATKNLFFSGYRKTILIGFSIVLFFILFLSILYTNILIYFIPFFILLGFYFILKPQQLYFLLMFVLPFTIEYDYKKSVFDMPSEPILFLLSAYIVVYSIINHKKIIGYAYNHAIVVFLFLHLLMCYLSVINSTHKIVSIKFCILKTAYILGFYWATLLFVRHKKNIVRLLYILWIPTLVTIVAILFLHARYHFSFDSINKAVNPIYRNHVNYGVFITMLFPFLFYLRQLARPQSIGRLFIDISVIITLVSIYFTYTRGAWLAILAMPIYWIILKNKWTKQLIIIAILLTASFGIFILKDYHYLKYAPNYDKTIYHENLEEHLASTIEMEDMSTVERFYRWLAAIKMSEKYFWLGVGAGNFASTYKPHTVAAYQTYISTNEEQSTVHNYFLLLLAEQGIVSALLFIVFIIYLLLLIEKVYYRQTDEQHKLLLLAIALSLLAFLINNTLSDLVEANKLGSLFFVILAMLTYVCNLKINPKN